MPTQELTLSQLTTPCCIIDIKKMRANIQRLSRHIGQLGCQLRPHVKTHKSIEITQEIIAGGNVNGITVSTLKEAEYFYQHGMKDILYAVGMVPNKLAKVASLMNEGCDLKLVLDNVEMAELVIERARQHDCVLKVMIELDTDGHRCGIDPFGAELIALGELLQQSKNVEFLGVMTHAGESYACFSEQAQQKMAKQERDYSIAAAQRLRENGIPCTEVSIGSTPTAFAIDELHGITEVRAGVYVFFDLVMAGLGVCDIDEIAISVLGSVIGYQKDKNWVITDAGWMAMSRDRGTSNHAIDQGYGLITDYAGEPMGDYIISDANQEHGIISHRDPTLAMEFEKFPLASLVRVLPNHACSTAAQFEHYVVVDGDKVLHQWQSIKGW